MLVCHQVRSAFLPSDDLLELHDTALVVQVLWLRHQASNGWPLLDDTDGPSDGCVHAILVKAVSSKRTQPKRIAATLMDGQGSI